MRDPFPTLLLWCGKNRFLTNKNSTVIRLPIRSRLLLALAALLWLACSLTAQQPAADRSPQQFAAALAQVAALFQPAAADGRTLTATLEILGGKGLPKNCSASGSKSRSKRPTGFCSVAKYHGRVLDYMRGIGMENNAAVIVFQPDEGNEWVNISYAGFVGSVTAMNAKQISIGEMGGRGEGNWDGKPMAQLIREVMEKASTLDEAIAIMRRASRTCEYYCVIADGNAHTAVGIAATPTNFDVIHTGEAHPRLPHAIKDAVLMSADDRYEELAKRVQAQAGQFDADSARDLMTRPVCMTSNIHSVLFAPDMLDFWVANADSANPASHTRYTHYNPAELLKPEAPKRQEKDSRP